MAKYSCGSDAEVGDIVKCIKPQHEPYHPLSSDRTYKVVDVREFHVLLEGHGINTYSLERFSLIKRTGAAPSPAKAEPLVKWPEESEELGSLKWGTLFLLVSEPDVPCVARSHGDYVPISGERAGTICTKSKSAKVRRIQFNPANKDSVFIVI